MVTPNMDHFGLEVSSKEELVAILDRAKAYQSKDDRVRITDVGDMVTRYQDKTYTLTNAYVWFLDPIVDRDPARGAAYGWLTLTVGFLGWRHDIAGLTKWSYVDQSFDNRRARRRTEQGGGPSKEADRGTEQGGETYFDACTL